MNREELKKELILKNKLLENELEKLRLKYPVIRQDIDNLDLLINETMGLYKEWYKNEN